MRMKKTCDKSGFSLMKRRNSGNLQPRRDILNLGVIFCLLGWVSSANQQDVYGNNAMWNNNGNRFFVQRPFSSPPTVRPPPYFNSHKSCSALNQVENWEGNLCGDLNKGEIPTNPMGQQDFNEDYHYPFEIIKNKTLEFFRQALPVLKTYKALPKVARFDADQQQHAPNHNAMRSRLRRDVDLGKEEDEGRGMKRYGYGSRVKRTQAHPTNNQMQQPHRRNGNNICENAIFCKLINTMYDKLPQGVQRLVSSDTHKRISNQFLQQLKSSVANGSPASPSFGELQAAETNHVTEDPMMPQTPCPSTAEYVTPVFARNHEGAWRYVVQIPREGYFTQTVEVTKCVQSSCLYLEGSCRSSPRWQSLLVAEMYYPDAAFPLNTEGRKRDSRRHKRSRADDLNGNMQRRRRNNSNKAGGYYEGRFVETTSSSSNTTTSSSQCDGYDEIGCYQFRLFYDWFLLPGECKCWKKSLTSLYQKY